MQPGLSLMGGIPRSASVMFISDVLLSDGRNRLVIGLAWSHPGFLDSSGSVGSGL